MCVLSTSANPSQEAPPPHGNTHSSGNRDSGALGKAWAMYISLHFVDSEMELACITDFAAKARIFKLNL